MHREPAVSPGNEAGGKDAGAELDRYAGLEPDSVAAERRERWEEELRKLAAAAKVDLAALPAQKSDAGKSMLAAAMKARTSVANAWLAEQLNMGKPASASQSARRWMLAPHGRGAVATLLSRIKT